MLFVILFPLLAIYLCSRAKATPSRSRKLGIYASASGIAAFAPIFLATTYMNGPQADSAFAFCGLLGVALAIVGLVLAIWTLWLRDRDQGVGVGIPIFGFLCGLAGIVCGVGVYAIAARVMIPEQEKTWTWHCDQHDFDVTIPSERWSVKPNSKALCQFVSSRPSITSFVAEAHPAESEEDSAKLQAQGLMMRNETRMANVVEERGTNAHGNEYWLYMGDAKSKQNEDYFFGFSISRLHGIGIVMILEGHFTTKSQAAHAQEVEAIRSQAKIFLSSVR